MVSVKTQPFLRGALLPAARYATACPRRSHWSSTPITAARSGAIGSQALTVPPRGLYCRGRMGVHECSTARPAVFASPRVASRRVAVGSGDHVVQERDQLRLIGLRVEVS